MPKTKEERLKETLLEAKQEQLVDALLDLYSDNRAFQKKLEVIFAGLSEKPNQLMRLIKREISALKRSTRFVHYYETQKLSDRLNEIRLNIRNRLFPKCAKSAFEAIELFMELDERTFNRTDDSYGTVGNVFRLACEDGGAILENEEIMPLDKLVGYVYQRCMCNEYGVYDNIIRHLKNALGDEGLQHLKQKIESSKGFKVESHRKEALKGIADCQGNVDEYIRVCLAGEGAAPGEHLEIAKRLIDKWRSGEALEWIEKAKDVMPPHWHHKSRCLKIQALELEGEYNKAQSERLGWFDETLSTEAYGELMRCAQKEEKETVREHALKRAFEFKHSDESIRFMIESQEYEALQRFIYTRYDSIDGRYYTTLRSAAEILQEIDPLAATLIYRKLVEPILAGAMSKYYTYAAKDLMRCDKLSNEVEAWGEYDSHEQYLRGLQERHKMKYGFWHRYYDEEN